jgi:hypothetical protein
LKTLVLWGRGSLREAQARVEAGASLLLWNDEQAAAFQEAGIPFTTLAEILGPAGADAVDEAAIGWTKEWGRRPLVDGKSFRELLTWNGVSLWWFAELYLHHSTGATARVRLVESLHRLLDALGPGEVEAMGLPKEEETLLARTCVARGVLFHGPRRSGAAGFRAAPGVALEARWNAAKTLLSALKAGLAGSIRLPPSSGRRRILFLSHAAFWQKRRDPTSGEILEHEHYFDRLIPEVERDPGLEAMVVAVGPTTAFRRRKASDRLLEWAQLGAPEERYLHLNRFTSLGVLRATLRSAREARRAWRSLRKSPGAHEAFAHRGVSFADLSGRDLGATLLLQLPWAVRSYEEMRTALQRLAPATLCLYAESSGWGRAALLAAQAEGIPSLALQHGILYPKYYSYRHAADEAACPLPDRTAVFGEAARRLLLSLGRYPPDSLTVTGSPKFDALVEAATAVDRPALRKSLGVSPDERLLVVASRFRGIRQTHQSIGSAFPALVRAVEGLAGVRCVVKPHPAEPAAAYQAVIRAAASQRVSVVPPSADLMELLQAADALVTVESLSALEALVLSRPVLVLNTPTNLQEMVDCGVALGVGVGEDPAPALRDLLFDAEILGRLEAARGLYLSDVAHGVDGRATERILALLRDLSVRRRTEDRPLGGA